LAAGVPVLFVEQAPIWNPADPTFSYRQVLRGLGQYLTKTQEGVYVLAPRTLPLGRFDSIRRLNHSWYAAAIWGAQKELGLRCPLFWVSYFEGCFSVLEQLKRPAYVYHCLDFLPYADKAEERALTQNATVVFNCSPRLLEDHRPYCTRNVLLPNGTDLELFQPHLYRGQAPPPDLPTGRRIIGYVGMINSATDLTLLAETAKTYRSHQVAIVGPVRGGESGPQGEQRDALKTLRELPNVTVIGFRPPERLAHYIAAFDVCVVPYVMSSRKILASDPLKFYQYLAMQKPIVSNNIPALESYADLCYLAATKDEFLAQIRNALNEVTSEKMAERRGAAARERSWPVLVERAHRYALECVDAKEVI
jgi:glycosyltransferase involved in cell wall biosynthesis